MIENLFAYGTLMCPEIIQIVTGKNLSGAGGTLKSYQRFSIKNEVYPGIIPAPGKVVDGIVYFGLSVSIWKLLDGFEGEIYLRQPVKILLIEERRTINAHTYIIKPQYADLLASKPWSYEKFLKTGKDKFLRTYKGFHTF